MSSAYHGRDVLEQALSGIEQTLLETLAKGNAKDPEFRKRVYNAAANALRRSLEAQSNLTVDAAQAQKDKLADAIRAVEQSYQAAAPTIAPPVKSPAKPSPARAKVAPSNLGQTRPGKREPMLRAEPKQALKAVPSKSDRVSPQTGKGSGPLRLKRGPFAAGLGTIALIGILAVGLVWVMLSGAFQDPATRDTAVPNPPPQTDVDNFEPRDPGTSTAPALRAQQSTADNWVTIFTPQDIATLRLEGAAFAEASSDPFGPYVLIITPPGASAIINLPPGPLQDLAGQRAQLEITAKTADGQTTQMSVECELGNGIDCVRTRFLVGQSPEAFIYRIDMTNVRRFNGGGQLVINSDLDGAGKEIKVISVRIRAEENV
ncbi:MAG: hypothetical protein AAFY99_04085 [Pseudomonadota bacterium]